MEQMDVDLDMKAGSSSELNAGEGATKSKVSAGTGLAATNVMADASTVPSVTISLHPLVIMNISEHWTRIRAQAGETCQVYGALIGKQKGRNIEVMNSFELKTDIVGDDVFINRDYYMTKEHQYKQVFSELDFIGWYTTGELPTEKDLAIHKQIAEINECPIMLQLNPLSRSVDQLPLKLYESVIDIVRSEATMLFVPLTYTLATEEAERIGVDHVARMSTNDTGEKSYVAEHLVAQESAIKMLNTRIKIVLKYIKEVEAGKLAANQEILREIYALSHRLPVMQGGAFQEEFYTQCNDVGLISYLGSMTKGCNDMNHFVNKFNVLYDRQGSGRRMRGLYF
ncbi:COP9 signalosome complex subunit 6 [Lucilia cuprina]|uniref:COP9 signalosome complex subunit 6 n=1 Tax=Lucilia cuprina TaxID=7375 RepID=A0A0L0C0W8_LUCCU|nr:COP9 signalosome complex subunit 6 [Lucilia cuprina]KAI8130934.1 COP9 signalosome complex subunit 6 [Lucilia cuprina]KAI8130935.1 COP9 signalosome complex subunit 6 [Lucilia cuprina]KAI8130936.1 COP9 signalosome complex subunit 6 [Lucilia cuprina]KNC25907.1 COP9 signalosome complex subunit 6 [Lucilia cuprina]KNC34432.1 COP9 signalosome complex subunit 6 [Lucilia cuprina]